MNQRGFVGLIVLVTVVLAAGVFGYWLKASKIAPVVTKTEVTPAPQPVAPAPVSPHPVSPAPVTPEVQKVILKANGTEDWIQETDNVTLSWGSAAKECTLTQEDMAFLVPGTGEKSLELDFSGARANRPQTFWITCIVNGKTIQDNVTIGGLLW